MSKKIQEKYLKYKNKLKISPNNPTYEYKINKYTKQFNDIHGAGIDIQKYLDDNNINSNSNINQLEEQNDIANKNIESNLNNIQNNMSTRLKNNTKNNNINGETLVEKVIDNLEYSQEELERLKFDYLNYKNIFMNQKNEFFEDIESYLDDLKKEYSEYVAVSNKVRQKFDKKIKTFHQKIEEAKKRNF